MSGQNEKATRYISSLNEALVSGSWSELPELIRKVTKHAPEKKCLIQTATAEHRAATFQISLRPNTPAKTNSGDLSGLIPPLQASLTSNNSPADVFETQACLAWIQWLLADPKSAASTAPKASIPSTIQGQQSENPSSQWTEICTLRSAYIKGASQKATGHWDESIETLQAAFLAIKYYAGKETSSPQLAYWSEQTLAQLAAVASHGPRQQPKDEIALKAFRLWTSTVAKSKEVLSSRYGNTAAHLTRLSTWQAYYELVSRKVAQEAHQASGDPGSLRIQLATELRRVEAQYESELLRTIKFPKANESNEKIEKWVEQVVQNWSILCGPYWLEHELGAGGRNAVGRNVLDILYRAASKTFHSTLILRQLFQVHKSLTDFDLAYRAFDTYVELIERDRERAAKTDSDTDLGDGHEIVFQTVAEGIEALCSFGRKPEAKKAYDLAIKIEEWSKRYMPNYPRPPILNGHPNGEVDGIAVRRVTLSEETLGLTYRAIGIAEAHWAAWSPFSELRTSLQTKALSNFNRATSLLEDNTRHRNETVFALGMLLAETREVDQAIEYIKTALNTSSTQVASGTGFATERKKVPLWHLLALLLTARQDFETAGQSCSAAFEQFGSYSVLLGSGIPKKSTSQLTVEKGSFNEGFLPGIVDDMECTELQRIMEIRITQLALIEMSEGPEEAVNSSNELLALYWRLFGHLDVGVAESISQKDLVPPQSSSNTVKSTRGSIFARKKQAGFGDSISEKINSTRSIREEAARPATQATEAPTIRVTDQDDKDASPKSHHFRKSGEHSHHEKKTTQRLHRREGSISKAIRRHSQERQDRKSLTSSHKQSLEIPQEQGVHQSSATLDRASVTLRPQHNTDEIPVPPSSITNDSSPEAKQALLPVEQRLTSHDTASPQSRLETKSSELDDHLPSADPTVTSTSPVPHFSKPAAQKHALTVLVKLWLVIAKLYRRASLFDDSREACDEAAKAAQKMESLVASVESSARAFADAGWGGGKSSDEVWADVFCDRAELALAQAAVRDEDGTEDSGVFDVRDAVEQFEQCLMYYPNHGRGVVGLSNVLLDYAEKKVDLGRRVDDGRPKRDAKKERRSSTNKTVSQNGSVGSSASESSQLGGSATDGDDLKKTPENLNRLAARDRAYGLLSTLTKLGTGWDHSEAWFALARAHELGGEMDKAKEILWWCVELEDSRPIRHWSNVGCAGYVL